MAMKAIAVLIVDFVDGADVGVIEGGGGSGFAFEAVEGLRVFGEFVGEKFEGDEAAELRCLRLCRPRPCRRRRVFR